MYNSFKSITFFFSDTANGRPIAEHAAALAARHGAHLTGILRIEFTPADFTGYARGTQAIQQTLAYLHQQHEQAIRHASRYLDELGRRHGISIECRAAWKDSDTQEAVVHGLHSDLVLIGHPSATGLAERLLLNGGAPLLIVPESWQGAAIGEKVVLGWNGSHQARRAIGDAMPFIANAAQVTVLVVNAERHPERFGQDPGADITHYLARHEAKVELDRSTSAVGSDAETISHYAQENGADLIVIGAYSRARIGQLLFGGVTRELLAAPAVPLLLAR